MYSACFIAVMACDVIVKTFLEVYTVHCRGVYRKEVVTTCVHIGRTPESTAAQNISMELYKLTDLRRCLTD